MLLYKKMVYSFTEDLNKLHTAGFLKVSVTDALTLMRKRSASYTQLFTNEFVAFLLDTIHREIGVTWDESDVIILLKANFSTTGNLIQFTVINKNPDNLPDCVNQSHGGIGFGDKLRQAYTKNKNLTAWATNLLDVVVAEDNADCADDEPIYCDLTRPIVEDNIFDNEINRVIQALSRKTRNSPLIVGDRGVGKTTVVKEFARRIVQGRVPEWLKRCSVWEVDIVKLLAGTKYRGDFEARLVSLIEAAATDNDVILFFDNFQNVVGAGATSTEGENSASDGAVILAPYIASGKIRVIATTTNEMLQKVLDDREDLRRSFQLVPMQEPDTDTAMQIMVKVGEEFNNFYNITIEPNELLLAIELAKRYTSDKKLPDSAIDLLDEACAKHKVQGNGSYLDRNMLYMVVSERMGIPVTKVSESDSRRLLGLEKSLMQRVKGQEEAIKAVANTIRCSRVGLQDATKPMGSFIFAGSTGVGKTELCKALAYELFSDDTAITRIDMSEYMTESSVNNLIGSPKGYIGYGEGGVLTSAVLKKPYSLILFDELEKAHPKVLDLLLQVLDDGRLTDNKGRTVNFRNTVIIMTTNLGAKKRGEGRAAGFVTNETINRKTQFKEAIEEAFRPEFINRIDDIITFNTLTNEVVSEIMENMLNDVVANLKKHNITATFNETLKNWVAEKGYSEEYGARPMKRFIEKEISMRLSNWILAGELTNGCRCELGYDAEKGVTYTITAQPLYIDTTQAQGIEVNI